MERLTSNNEEIKTLQAKNATYWLKVYFKLKEYEDAEEQGLLVRLPCKVGDVFYEASRQWKTVLERKVASIAIYNNSMWLRNGCGDSFEYGVEVFLTKEEAEKALEEMEKK